MKRRRTGLTGPQRESKLEMARRYESGSLSKAAFCRSEKVSTGSLDHWVRVLRQERLGDFVEASFVEVEVSAAPPRSERPHVEVELPFGVKLRFFGVQP